MSKMSKGLGSIPKFSGGKKLFCQAVSEAPVTVEVEARFVSSKCGSLVANTLTTATFEFVNLNGEECLLSVDGLINIRKGRLDKKLLLFMGKVGECCSQS